MKGCFYLSDLLQGLSLSDLHLGGSRIKLGNLEEAGSYGGFLKWWYPTTMGFPTKNDHFGVFWGYHHLRKHPYTCKVHLLWTNVGANTTLHR